MGCSSFIQSVKWYLSVIILRFLQVVHHWILNLFQDGRKKTVPSTKNPILCMSASKIAEKIREKTLRSEDVVKAFITRIRQVNPYINAVAEERFEEALAEARSVDLLIQSEVKSPEEIAAEKPLLGVPISVKMIIKVKGLRCNAGSLFYKDVEANEDAEVVIRMKNAGAICIVTTNSPELAINIETHNHIYGVTKNPHDTRLTPGGSSGGESALISAAGSVLGIGNDLIGSLRYPAFCTGIFSHKPTNGIVSNKGIFPSPNDEMLWHVCTGPMCRYSEDLSVAMKLLLDPRYSHIKEKTPVDFSSVTVYYLESDGVVPAPDIEIIQALRKVINHFKETHGAKTQKVEIKSLKYSTRTVFSTVLRKLNGSLKDVLYGEEAEICPKIELLKCAIRRSEISVVIALAMNVELIPLILPSKEKSQMYTQMLEAEMNKVLGENSVLISPTFPKNSVYHYGTPSLALGSNYTSVCNLLGFPATQCPVGTGADGLPLGVQVIGALQQDFLTIAFATEIERAFGGWIVPKG